MMDMFHWIWKGGGGDMNNFEYKMACSAPEQ